MITIFIDGIYKPQPPSMLRHSLHSKQLLVLIFPQSVFPLKRSRTIITPGHPIKVVILPFRFTHVTIVMTKILTETDNIIIDVVLESKGLVNMYDLYDIFNVTCIHNIMRLILFHLFFFSVFIFVDQYSLIIDGLSSRLLSILGLKNKIQEQVCIKIIF